MSTQVHDHLIVEYSLTSSGDDITYTYHAYDVPTYEYTALDEWIHRDEVGDDEFNPTRHDVHVVNVTDGNGRTLTRDVSLALASGLNEDWDVDGDMSDRATYNVVPTGDHDSFVIYTDDGTEFKVTIERRA